MEDIFCVSFIHGIRTDILLYVLRHQSITVIDDFDLACIYDYSFSNAKLEVRDSHLIKQASITDSVSHNVHNIYATVDDYIAESPSAIHNFIGRVVMNYMQELRMSQGVQLLPVSLIVLAVFSALMDGSSSLESKE